MTLRRQDIRDDCRGGTSDHDYPGKRLVEGKTEGSEEPHREVATQIRRGHRRGGQQRLVAEGPGRHRPGGKRPPIAGSPDATDHEIYRKPVRGGDHRLPHGTLLPEGRIRQMRQRTTSGRPHRLAELLRERLALILLHKSADPRLQELTLTRVEMSPDLRQARVYYETRPQVDETRLH